MPAEELQVIPARHGTATFVPAGRIIKIVNTSGTQVVDTWAFALPTPDPKKGDDGDQQEAGNGDEQSREKKDESKPNATKSTPVKKKRTRGDLPSQEEAEEATRQNFGQDGEGGEGATPQKKTWSSYVPSLGWSKDETEQQKNSKTWASYFPSGKGFSNYIPKSATEKASAFAASHKRDPSKSYIEQLQQFSKTPVGAAGLAALTGSGYGGSMFAGYQAWNSQNAPDGPPMEYMSMPHSRAAMLNLRPRVNDTLVSNLRAPMLTLVEDASSGIHDTLMAACDPARYQGLGVEKWDEHGSCAENLVLALQELNERAGLKGAKAIGAEVAISSVPAPLNLFMNIPWDDSGEISFDAPKCKAGDYVCLRAERDVVVVMSACPQDILEINAKKPTDAHFIVEDEAPKMPAQRKKEKPVMKKSIPPRAATSVSKGSASDASGNVNTPRKKAVPKGKTAPAAQPASAVAARPVKKPVPKPVAPSKKTEKTDAGNMEDDAPTPAARKKPRKLNAKPKPDASSAS